MKSKILTIFLTIVLIIAGSITSVFAATPTFGGKYQSGVGNVTIYVDYASGAGYWEVYMQGGANNWMYPGSGMSNPIYMQFVSSSYGSKMDFYAVSDTYWAADNVYGVLAETSFFNGNTQIYPSTGSSTQWEFTEIRINDDNFRSSSFSNDQAQGTVIHEMGHAFGLAHYNSNPYSIMCQTGAGRVVQRVQATDNDAINAKY